MELILRNLGRFVLASCVACAMTGCETGGAAIETRDPDARVAGEGGPAEVVPDSGAPESNPPDPHAGGELPAAPVADRPGPEPGAPAAGEPIVAPAARVVPSRGPAGGGPDDDFLFKSLSEPASRRAFYTAPPVIPHAMGDSDRECVACHTSRRRFQGRVSTLTPHPDWVNCQQCHVRGASPAFLGVIGAVKSTWRGLPAPGLGTRAYEGAPPTIPHRIFLRENCRSCHHTLDKEPHYSSMFRESVQCFQCHVLMRKDLDF